MRRRSLLENDFSNTEPPVPPSTGLICQRPNQGTAFVNTSSFQLLTRTVCQLRYSCSHVGFGYIPHTISRLLTCLPLLIIFNYGQAVNK